MTPYEIIQYYANLLIFQYKSKPRAKAQVQLFIEEALLNLLPLQVQNAFSIDVASGVQLDILGKYTGVSRTNNGFTGPITLDDNDFRQLINMAILSNSAGSSLYEIQNLLQIYFGGQVLVFDNKAMSLSYYMDSTVGTVEFAQVVVVEGLLPKPMGVGISSVIYYNNINRFFGMGSYEMPIANITPFNDYDLYDMNSPWLNYSYALFY